MDDENGPTSEKTISTTIYTPKITSHQGCSTHPSEKSALSTTCDKKSLEADAKTVLSTLETESDLSQNIVDRLATAQSTSTNNRIAEAEETMDEEVLSENREDVSNFQTTGINGDNAEAIEPNLRSSTDSPRPHFSQSVSVQSTQSAKQPNVLETTDDLHSYVDEKSISSESEESLSEILSPRAEDETIPSVQFTRSPDIVENMSLDEGVDHVDAHAREAVLQSERRNEAVQPSVDKQVSVEVASFCDNPESAITQSNNDSQSEQIVNKNSKEPCKDDVYETNTIASNDTVIGEAKSPTRNLTGELVSTITSPTNAVAEEAKSIDSSSCVDAAGSDDDGCHRNGDLQSSVALDESLDDVERSSCVSLEHCNVADKDLPVLPESRSETLLDVEVDQQNSNELGLELAATPEMKMNGESGTTPSKPYYEKYPEDEQIQQSPSNISYTDNANVSTNSNSNSIGNRSMNNSRSNYKVSTDSVEKSPVTTVLEREKWQNIANIRDSMFHISPSVNPLKRRASDTPLERGNERRRRFSSGELESKQTKLCSQTSVGQSSSGTSYGVIDGHYGLQDSGKMRKPDACEFVQDKIVDGLLLDIERKHGDAIDSHANIVQRTGNSKRSLNTSSDCVNSPLQPDPDETREDAPGAHLFHALGEKQAIDDVFGEAVQQGSVQSVEKELPKREDEEDDGNSSSSGSSSSSSNTSSSSSSSSSSSESDSSDDEAEDSAPASHHQSPLQPVKQINENRTQFGDQQPTVHSIHAPSVKTTSVSLTNFTERDQPTITGQDDMSEEDSPESAAMEIEQSPAESDDEDEPERRSKLGDEAKITRSEGLKLSISLKRSSTVATPTRSEDSPVVKRSSTVLPPQQHALQPVDFSNLLQKGLLLNENQELKKIDYNNVPGLNHTKQTCHSVDVSLNSRMSEVQEQLHQQKRKSAPAPWSNDYVFGIATPNILNTYKLPLVAPLPQEESSDTLDEDNRLVIAEKKQRRSRKKANQNPLVAPAVLVEAYSSVLSNRQEKHPFDPAAHTLQQQFLTPNSVSQLLQQTNGRDFNSTDDTFQATYFSNENAPLIPTFASVPVQPSSKKITTMNSAQVPTNAPNGRKGTAKRPADRRKKPLPTPNSKVVGEATAALASSAFVGGYNFQKQTEHGATVAKGSGCISRRNVKQSTRPATATTQIPAHPPGATGGEKKKDKKKVFLCSPCGTHYENWNLFLHMREVHRKHICLYCLGIFPSAERLVNHLGTKHGVQKKLHGSLEDYLHQHHHHGKNGTTLGRKGDTVTSSAGGSTQHQQPFYLMCSRCEHMFESTISSDNVLEGEQQIMDHDCANFLEKCVNCGQLKLAKHRCSVVVADANGPSTSGDIGTKKKVSRKAMKNMANECAVAKKSTLSKKKLPPQPQSHHHPQHPVGVGGSILQTQLLKKAHNGPLTVFNTPPAPPVPKPVPERLKANRIEPKNLSPQPTVPLYEPIESPHPIVKEENPQESPKAAPIVVPSPPPTLNEVDEPVAAPANIPAPSTTPLVPKLKVKIPIQYLTPMESEESSVDSDEENVDAEEDDDESEEEDEEEDDKDTKKNDEQETAEKDRNAASDYCDVKGRETTAKDDLDEPKKEACEVSERQLYDVLPDGNNETTLADIDTSNQQPNAVETDFEPTATTEAVEDTSQQEPIPMDIDETITADRTHDAPVMAMPLANSQSHTHHSESLIASANVSEELSTTETADTEKHDYGPDPKGDANITSLHSREQEVELNTASVNAERKEELVEGAVDQTQTAENANVSANEMEVFEETPCDIDGGNALVVADSDAQLFQLSLDEPLDRIPIREFIKICVRMTVPFCLYCNHARRIAVCVRQLVLHIIATHRFQATVNSITGEELLPETILQRFRAALDELDDSAYLNVETFDNSWTVEQRASVPFVRQFECFQCRFVTLVHKELYLHNRKMHQKSVLVCLMCRGNFFSYSELLCHLCPGLANQMTILDYTFRCCVCNSDGIPSAFRLMVHLRKRHFACDVCLEECHDQGRLSNHVWKHKLHHLCYRCGIGYRNKADILKHLFWKHGTEGVLCKRCLQKKWPHVYHFCVPPAQFVCDVCQASFGRSVALKVHQRLHNGDAKYPCSEDGCEKRFISKKLLLKHVQRHFPDLQVKEEQKEEGNASGIVVVNPVSLMNGEADDEKRENATESPTEPVIDMKIEISDMTLKSNRSSSAKEDAEQQQLSTNDSEHSVKHEQDRETDKSNLNDAPNGSNKASNDLSSGENEKLPSNVHEQETKVATVQKDEPTSSKKSKKKRKTKDDVKSMVDLMNLPALNLSESDSSDDSDNESSNGSFSSKRFQEWANNTESSNGINAADAVGKSDTVLESQPRMQVDGDEQQKSVAEDIDVMEDTMTGIPLSPSAANRVQTMMDDSGTDIKAAVSDANVAGPCLDPIANIWNNFKRYQAHHRTASRRQSADEEQRIEDELVEKMLKHTILHVSQSDHDYCMMYKPLLADAELAMEGRSSQQQESLLVQADRKGERENEENADVGTPKKSQTGRSSRKRTTDHSSDSDSSDSDSSCECGSNCSCSSSSSNSSSSSSDDSDSSDEGSARRSKKLATVDQEAVSPGRVEHAEAKAEYAETGSSFVDAILPPEPLEPIDPDSVIVDSDLQTDESETDEEFYDDHPQKRANQMLADKRRELLAQTCAVTPGGRGSPAMMSYGIVENSRPSTPSLPPEEQQQGKKKLKVKKRKRERKSSKRMFSPKEQENVTISGEMPVPFELSTAPGSISATTSHSWIDHTAEVSGLSVRPSLELPFVNNQSPAVPASSPLMPVNSGLIAVGDLGKINTPRLSTGNSSESDAPLKRSQRSRKPNKFYGYTSDDESAAASLPLPAGIPLSVNPEKSILSLMKPTPPPNLVWSKEDLPSPPAKFSVSGAGSKIVAPSTQRRSVDHLTPVSSRRNSGVGMPPEETGVMLPAGYVPQAAMALASITTPTQLQRPPLPKLKLSLGKKTPRVSLGIPKRNQISRRRKATPKTPKTPKSAPPLVASGAMVIGTPAMLSSSAPLSAPVVPPSPVVGSVSMYHPPIVDNRPKIPPIGSFPSVQTDMFRPSQIRVPAGWRAPREGESVYCYCRAPYDEVSEMIACDGENCRIEWFHFECVGIIMPPKGKWFCPECKVNQPPLVEDVEDPLFQHHSHHGELGGTLSHPTSTNGPSTAQSSSSGGIWGQQHHLL